MIKRYGASESPCSTPAKSDRDMKVCRIGLTMFQLFLWILCEKYAPVLHMHFMYRFLIFYQWHKKEHSRYIWNKWKQTKVYLSIMAPVKFVNWCNNIYCYSSLSSKVVMKDWFVQVLNSPPLFVSYCSMLVILNVLLKYLVRRLCWENEFMPLSKALVTEWAWRISVKIETLCFHFLC